MILRSFDKRHTARATVTAFIGISVGILLDLCVEWLYTKYSWRIGLRIFSVMLALVGYPSAFVMTDVRHPEEKHLEGDSKHPENEESINNNNKADIDDVVNARVHDTDMIDNASIKNTTSIRFVSKTEDKTADNDNDNISEDIMPEDIKEDNERKLLAKCRLFQIHR
ncbi:uncharacterized protein [Antedon mediterranea]|uniref:uncharacterized protein isoform X2 n=1 Tax=Antedon mediterranea TaxID=105859 RepID=UPI003AF52DA9